MSEKGGKDKYIESHHIMLIFMIVLNFAILVLCLVFLGMQLVKREENISQMKANQTSGEYIEEIHPLRFFSLGSSMYESEDGSVEDGSSLLLGEVAGQAEYKIIESSLELSELVNSARSVVSSPSNFDYAAVDEDFFTTGCVIAVAYEDKGLENFSVNKMTRDETGNITLVANYSSSHEVESIHGALTLVKIDNVQPKAISLDIIKQ